MSYNDGAPKNPLKIHDKHQAAHDFAEGNVQLEQLLNYCFDNNILTSACCAGHKQEYNEINESYVSFYVCKENETIIRHLIGELYNKGYNINYTNRIISYPLLTIYTSNIPSNIFKDILDIIKSYQQYPITELSSVISKIIANTADKYESIIKIERKDNGILVGYYVEYDYKEELIPEEEIIEYLNNKTDSFYYDLSKEQAFPAFKDIKTKERLWYGLQPALQSHNIEFTDPSIIDLTEFIGAFGKDTTIKKELIVNENDTIEIIADKLDFLKEQYINTKAVFKGIELVNFEYQETTSKRGKTIYNNIFNKERCIDQYYEEIISTLNKNVYSGELEIIRKHPLNITFSNQHLSDTEIAKRLVELNKIGLNAWLVYPYVNFKVTDATNYDITLNALKKRKKWQMESEIIQILSIIEDETLISKLFNIYLKLDLENLSALFAQYRNIITNSSINIEEVNNKFIIANNEFNSIHKYLQYDTYILYKTFKSVLESQKDDQIICGLLEELDSASLANEDTGFTIKRIIQKYRRYIENKKDFSPNEFQKEFRL